MRIIEFTDERARSPFAKWFNKLDSNSASRVLIALSRLADDNFSNVKSLGSGVFECKLYFGPGYRIYFGIDGEDFVVLLAGGTKKRQSKDIMLAKKYWEIHKTIKKER